ncbi:MAG: D-aminoacylase [Actinobacteria bacterium]|nr:MAG: D-aminoacylase [Actinomycetota bacterium]
MLDLLIRGGTVIDGTGAKRRRADVGVRAGHITEVGGIDEPARRVIDAGGLVVAPGFVDIHTHYDAQLFWDPGASPSSLHGVTTVVGGNCGFTLAPLVPEDATYLMRLMARVEGMPLASLETGVPWNWTTFGEYLDRLDGTIAVNAGFLVGHSAIRRRAMGDAAVGEPSTAAQREVMARLLHEALDAGALGFSSSQAPTHNDGEGNPVPSRAADHDELVALAAVVGEHQGTQLELILAGTITEFTDVEMDLMASMSAAANRPLNWNVLGIDPRDHQRHHRQLLASTRAAERGGRVIALTVPKPPQVHVRFDTGFVLDALPGWSDIFQLPVPERMRALSEPSVRQRLREGASSPPAGGLRRLFNWPRMQVAETGPANASLVGRTFADIGSERGQDPFDAVLDVVVSDQLRTVLLCAIGDVDDETWRVRAELWKDPRTVVGGSDAGAHLDVQCGATLSSDLLGDAVRERQLLSLEEAIHELTDVPARLYGLRGRGRVLDGWCADVVVFDPERIDNGPMRTQTDLPGGASRLFADARGVEHVIVNGREIVAQGELTGAVPGTLLRSGRDTTTVEAAGTPVYASG